MNIAMMTNSFAPLVGGVPISVARLARGLRDSGHSVTVFAPEYPESQGKSGPENKEEDVVRCRTFGSAGSFVAPSFFDPRPFKEFRRRRFDLIHVHHPMLMGNVAWVLSGLHDLPLVFTWHTLYSQYMHYLGWMRSLENQAERGRTAVGRKMAAKLNSLICQTVVPWYIGAFARQCDRVLVPSPGIRKTLSERTGDLPVQVLPTGVPESFFTCQDEDVKNIRRRWAPDGRRLFCTVSRLAKEKNIAFLLRALTAFKGRGGEPFRLLVIGDGPQREQLESEVDRLGLAEEVSFLGSIPNDCLTAYYHAADFFLFSSKTETQGIVLLEAMAGETPIIAVEASGVRDVVKNGENGRLVNEAEEDFAAALSQMCRTPEIYRRCAGEALATARRYSVAHIAALAEDTYLEAIAHRRKEAVHDRQTVHLVSETSGTDLPH